MLRKVKLYGELAKFVGHKEFEVKVDTVGKAVSFLIHNFPGIESYMSPKYYQVKVGSYDIDKNEIYYPIGKEDIHFIPVITGSGSVNVFSYTFSIDVQAGQYIELMWATDDTNITLDHQAAASPAPVVPSTLVTVILVSALPETLPTP